MAATDDISRTVAVATARAVLDGEARNMRASGGLSLGEVGKAAGVTAETVSMWESGLARPTTQQALAWLTLVTDRAIAQRASFNTSMRQGHAGGDIMGGYREYTLEAVQASVDQLRKDFPSWRIDLPDGAQNFGTSKNVKLVWSAHRNDDSWPDVHAATAAELRDKLTNVEASLKHDAEQLAAYQTGKGVRGRVFR